MVRREQYRDAKGLMQRVEAMIRATLPRQAWVTRTDSTKVYVRFNGETGADPESEFISTVAGVPGGTMGWVIRLGGKKGLFVVTGIPKPVTPPLSSASTSISGSTSGDYFSASHAVTITGLIPGRTYVIDWMIDIRTTGTASRSFGPAIQYAGSTSGAQGSATQTETQNSRYTLGWSRVEVGANSSGEITLTPGFRWSAGSVSANWIRFKVTLQ